MNKINYVANHRKDGGRVFFNDSIKTWRPLTSAQRRIMYFLVRYLRRETQAGRGFFLMVDWGWMWLRYGGQA